MSAFLGPIHFWLYNKIQIQQGMVEEILALSENLALGLSEDLDTRYGVSETEYKLAYAVTFLTEKNPDIIKKIESIFQRTGKKIASSIRNTGKK